MMKNAFFHHKSFFCSLDFFFFFFFFFFSFFGYTWYWPKSKDNQTMKFYQLIEYNLRHIFFQKSRRKWGRETSSRSFLVFQKSFIWGTSKLVSTPYFQYALAVLDFYINCIKFLTVDPKLYLLSFFSKMVWN